MMTVRKVICKCRQCGHRFEGLVSEGGFIPQTHLPHCPKCGSGDVKEETNY